MLVYTNAKFKPKKKRKAKGVVAVKFNAAKYMDKRSTYVPSYIGGGLRPGANDAGALPSLESTACCTGRQSMTDAAVLAKEPKHVQDEIIAKSKRIAIAYNKGAYQYVTDGTDPKTLGSGERLRRG